MKSVLAQRVGGSCHASQNLTTDFTLGFIPKSLNGEVLRQATLNLVLETGALFRTPSHGGATREYVASNGETYFLQQIVVSVLDPTSRQPLNRAPGFIHRNSPHPIEFNNIVEVIAPDLTAFLRPGLKDWFLLEGPFDLLPGGVQR